MHKISTIFDRNWEGDKTVIDKLIVDFDFSNAIATEKIDGMNVRVTVRNHMPVRMEKRHNPDKTQKHLGIVDPWYEDIDKYGPEDKWLRDALFNTDFSSIPDGEWSGEAVGTNIQGNPLNLDKNMVVFFTLDQCPVFENVPTSWSELKDWLPLQKSKFGNNCGIEGIVWHGKDGRMCKIKTKDFVKDNR